MTESATRVAADPLNDVVAELRTALRGDVVTAEHAGYGEARKVWNGMFDQRSPVAVLRCADEEDVRRAVALLADVEAPMAVRGGGHHIAGFGGCDGGFVIDLGGMRAVTVDPEARRLRVGGGGTLHDIDTASAEHKLSVPIGLVSPTGIAGLTLTGGVGWQTRRYGYACDNLRSARVVTASGDVVVASEDENSDLLWGLRGGGGNFGIVTEFEFEAYPRDEVLVTLAVFEPADAEEIAEVLRAYREWSLDASNDHTIWWAIGPGGKDFASILPDLVGKLTVSVFGVSLDVSDAARAKLEEIERWGSPVFADTSSMRMVELQHMGDEHDTAVAGIPRYMKGEMMSELTDQMIVDIATSCTELPTPTSSFEMGMVGGAMSEIGEMEAAVGMRAAEHLGGFSIAGEPGEDITAAIDWARDRFRILLPGSVGGTYLNFDGDVDDVERVLDSLGADRGDPKRERLAALKRTWDPGNRFRINHNIPPAT